MTKLTAAGGGEGFRARSLVILQSTAALLPWPAWSVCVLAVGVSMGCDRAGQARTANPTGGPPRSVQVAKVVSRPMERAITVTGTLAAHEESTLSAKVAGRLQRLAVDLGSIVKEGDVLAQIEPRDFELRSQQAEAALSQARAGLGLPGEGDDDRVEVTQVNSVQQAKAVLEEAASNRERVRALSVAGIASPSEVDTVEAAFKVASTRHAVALEDARTRLAAVAQRRAEYEIARKQLADTSVRAPFDGAVQARPASVGEYVATGTPIVTLVKADPLRLKLDVPERDAVVVRLGQEVRLSVEGDTNVYTGRIARLSPALNEANRVLMVEADVIRQGVLRPGLYARARIIVAEGEEGLSIPMNALLTFAGLEKVVLVKESKAIERNIVTGRRGPDWVEVTSGVAAGDAVVLGPAGLRHGQALAVTSSPPDSPASRPAPGRGGTAPAQR